MGDGIFGVEQLGYLIDYLQSAIDNLYTRILNYGCRSIVNIPETQIRSLFQALFIIPQTSMLQIIGIRLDRCKSIQPLSFCSTSLAITTIEADFSNLLLC